MIKRFSRLLLPVLGVALILAAAYFELQTGFFLKYPLMQARADRDGDNLPDAMEQMMNTNPDHADSDGDDLDDYEEVRKYRTNPLKQDSDGDGQVDSVWEERREYAYSIKAIVDLRPPFDVTHMNDFFQDARVMQALPEDAARVEIVLYPEAKPFINPGDYFPADDANTQNTYAKNLSPASREKVRRLTEGSKTDLQAAIRILRFMMFQTKTVDIQELGYESSLPLQFNIFVDGSGHVNKKGLASTSGLPMEEILDRQFFADGMYENRIHGACSSTATLRGGLLRAAGIPEKTIMTIPLFYSYEHDGTVINVEKIPYSRKALNIPEGSAYVSDHFFNLVKIGNQWLRVDASVCQDPFVGPPKPFPRNLYIKILECDDQADYDYAQYWNYETWADKRPYTYILVEEQEPCHER